MIYVDTAVSKTVPKGTFIKDNMTAFGRRCKRVIDCIAAAVAMVIFAPLFAICYIAIRREDGGPAIYAQERIGWHGKPFKIYKFRSMRLDAEKMGPQLSHGGGENDPRLTKVGAFIRAHHLDELPQLFNVIRGDMSLVGPRPLICEENELHDGRQRAGVYALRPGITGMAQIGGRNSLDDREKLEKDTYYLHNLRPSLDAKILFSTLSCVIKREGS